MHRPKILHVIDSLGLGGAEKLLVSTVNRLIEFDHVVVSLHEDNRLASGLDCDYVKLSFNFSILDIWAAGEKLKAVIDKHKVDVVHSHLYWSTIIARVSAGKLPVVSTYHSLMYLSGFGSNLIYRNIDKLTYRSRFHTICVSKTVQKHIHRKLHINRNSSVIYNFVDDKFSKVHWRPREDKSNVRILSVGNIKPAKNYFEYLPIIGKMEGVIWHIVGGGPFLNSINKQIRESGVNNVEVLTNEPDVDKIMNNYDLFFMPSKSEGFGIALAEALTAGMPCLVSDIETFREIGGKNVCFIEKDKKLSDTIKRAISQGGSGDELLFQRESSLSELSQLYSQLVTSQ